MNTIIAAPIRVNSFSELKPGEKIWSISRNGRFEIIEFVKIIEGTNENYSIFLNMAKNGMDKFYKGRLSDEKWYRYEDNETTWYHIYSAQAKFYEDEANNCKELACKELADLEKMQLKLSGKE